MPPAPLPHDEAARLADLYDFRILDTPPEAALDAIVGRVAALLGTPMAAVSFIDDRRQWFKARCGLDVAQTSRDASFCAWMLVDPLPLVVPDATLDPRFADNPLVLGQLGVRFYLGVPLISPDGHGLGALCALDRVPHQPTLEQVREMTMLARQVMRRIELQRALAGEPSPPLARRVALIGA